VRVLRLVDQSRTVQLPGGRGPRTLLTIVRYPAVGAASARDLAGAPAARAAGPFPLIVFGHGFAVTPGLYASLLHAWAQAGYVVAAPVFPLEQANAPGGPNESDLINQPQDMRFVITRMLAASATAKQALSGLVDPRRVAVAGQSDGGETALAVAYDAPFRDARVRAAVILSGAKIPGLAFAFPRQGSRPLLATQGSADTVNPPSFTHAFYDSAPRPKYLLDLPGASHLPPYSTQQPQLGIVERVTVAFLHAYLNGDGGSAVARRLSALGNVAGAATLQAQP
jgi:dienelactone hydrolase